MAFLGKEFKFVKNENLEALVNSLDVPEEQKKGLSQLKPTVRIVKNGDTYTQYTTAPGYSKEISFESGKEFEELVRDKYKSKTTYVVEGNKIVQDQKFEAGFDFKYVREFNGDDLVLTITYSKWDGVAKMYFKA